MSKRRNVIAGNWKMNMTPSQAKNFASELYEAVKGKRGCDIVVCVPAIDIPAVVKVCAGTAIKVGAQNVHFKNSGAYTGEISPEMLIDAGVKYVVIGHSERRQYFGETDETVNLRTKAAVAAGLTAIVCVGETLTEREQGITSEVVAKQVKLALSGITADQMKKIIIAYEPVWAIGTGKTATAEQADEVCGLIRGVVAGLYGKVVARGTVIQYGGSMNAANAAELLAMDNIDGGLIGGASLKADAFATIVDAAQ